MAFAIAMPLQVVESRHRLAIKGSDRISVVVQWNMVAWNCLGSFLSLS
jgi:hypothetical protein